jgi:hypothetical protein
MISASDPFRALRARAVVVRSAAVAATVELKCPIVGCDYQTTLVLGKGKTTTPEPSPIKRCGCG